MRIMSDKNVSYIICATPRSGSTLLCDLLTDTDKAGCPNSFFSDDFFTEWANKFNLSVDSWSGENEFDHSYLDAVINKGKGNSSVFGMRLMCESVLSLSERLKSFYPESKTDYYRFQSAFGNIKYIHLSREDKVAQAVSRLRAEQSGLWHIHSDMTERERLKTGHSPVYDFNKLSAFINQLEENDLAWSNWFIQQGIEPLHISYEELSTNPHVTLKSILSYIGIEFNIGSSITPRTARMANEESNEWIARYIIESKLS